MTLTTSIQTDLLGLGASAGGRRETLSESVEKGRLGASLPSGQE